MESLFMLFEHYSPGSYGVRQSRLHTAGAG